MLDFFYTVIFGVYLKVLSVGYLCGQNSTLMFRVTWIINLFKLSKNEILHLICYNSLYSKHISKNLFEQLLHLKWTSNLHYVFLSIRHTSNIPIINGHSSVNCHVIDVLDHLFEAWIIQLFKYICGYY